MTPCERDALQAEMDLLEAVEVAESTDVPELLDDPSYRAWSRAWSKVQDARAWAHVTRRRVERERAA